VLFLFVVMLVNLDVAMNQAQFNRQWALALGTVLVLLAELGYALFQQGRRGLALPLAVPTLQSAGNTQEVGLASTGAICCRSRSLQSCCLWR